jgi:plasmid maintenance system antidote protein VapI
MAIRLAHLLGNTPESWLNMQQALDAWELERKNARIYDQIEKVA